MIPILHLNLEPERRHVEKLLAELRLNPAEVAVAQGPRAKDVAAVEKILADVAQRGDDAIVESSRKFDDPNFSLEQIRVTPEEMKSAAGRVSPEIMSALRRSIAQVREYQSHVMPQPP